MLVENTVAVWDDQRRQSLSMKTPCDWPLSPTCVIAKQIMMNCWAKDGSEQKQERALEAMLNGFVRSGRLCELCEACPGPTEFCAFGAIQSSELYNRFFQCRSCRALWRIANTVMWSSL